MRVQGFKGSRVRGAAMYGRDGDREGGGETAAC